VAVIGPEVPPLGALASATRAETVLSLIGEGAVEGSGLVRADDHLADLVTHAQPAALAQLAEHRLAPLAAETPASRARLTETLRAWLELQGDVAKVATTLHVHPQTVRYRVGRLRERLGDALDDPDARFELQLALRGGRFAQAPVRERDSAEKEV
jgi:DNA-binding PucR family transcriptional regulator